MSELKAFDIVVAEEYYCEGIVKYRRAVYDKSEADKVIAELEDKILQYTVLYKEKYRDINTQERFFAQERAHDKYKRCLAMARWCENRSDKLFEDTLSVKDFGFEPSDELTFKLEFFRKWHRRWLELAEKFKEVKFH